MNTKVNSGNSDDDIEDMTKENPVLDTLLYSDAKP
jgi:hypothetical protein